MKHPIAVVFILVGLGLGALALTVLPAGHGRLEYMIEVVDPRPASEGAC